MTTALDIITDALTIIGAYDSASPITDADSEYCLRTLNDMIDQWSNQSLACFQVLEQSAPLVIGQASYTIGPGGNFNMTRPLRILQDPGSCYMTDTNGNVYPMNVVARDQWNLYANRSNLITANFPNVLFYDPQFPLGVINILPFPNLSYTMFWDSYLQLTEFASLVQVVSLPPGYVQAMKYNLAGLIFPAFLDGQLSPVVAAVASTSLGTIKRTNSRDNRAIYDSEIVSRANVQYNVYTDTAGSTVPVT